MLFEVVIIDDEPKAIELLKYYINQVDTLVIKQTFRNPLKAYHYLSTVIVDIVFLDINMPQLSGLDLLSNLKNKPNVIFTTAHAEYAINGFDLDAIDYLLKPISFKRFLKSVQKFTKSSKGLEKVDSIPKDPLYIKSSTTNYKFYWRDIKYLKKKENYIEYHLLDGRMFLSRGTLSEIENMFPSYVIRVHKSYAICLYNISLIETSRILIETSEIPIGRKYKAFCHLKFSEHKLEHTID